MSGAQAGLTGALHGAGPVRPLPTGEVEPLPNEAMLTVEGLGLGYGTGAAFVPAVEDVSFQVRRGETAALLGPSGCGKSTILELLTTQPSEAAGLLARQLAEPETHFTGEPVGVAALASFMHETGFLRSPAGKLDDLLFRL